MWTKIILKLLVHITTVNHKSKQRPQLTVADITCFTSTLTKRVHVEHFDCPLRRENSKNFEPKRNNY